MHDKDASPGGMTKMPAQRQTLRPRDAMKLSNSLLWGPLQTTKLRLWECFPAAGIIVLRGSGVWGGGGRWRSRDQLEPC